MRLGAALLVALLSGCYDTHGDPVDHPAVPDEVTAPPPEPDVPPEPSPEPDPEPAPPPDVVDPGPGPGVLGGCDPALPRTGLGQYTNGVAAWGSIVYAVYETDGDEGGLAVLDTSGELPVQVGHLESNDGLRVVEILEGGDRLLVGGDDRLHVIDVSDRTAPEELASVPLGDRANGVAASGDLALVADGYEGVDVFDISGPLPERVATLFDAWYAWDVEIADGLAWIATGLYEGESSGLQVFDLSDSWAPTEVSRLDTAGAVEVEVALPWVYVGDSHGTVRIVDATDPWDLEDVAHLTVNDDLRAMTLDGDRLVVGGLGLWFVDVADPAHATELGHVDVGMWVFDVAIADGVAHAAGAGVASVELSCTR